MRQADFPPFVPHRLLRSGHAQTVAAVYFPGTRVRYAARRHCVPLEDGDSLVLHDDCPAGWRPGDRAALLVHGLAGCHQSPYMRRLAHKLPQRGVRCFRLDLRGAGAGALLARKSYHAGSTGDLAAAVEHARGLCPGSPLTLAGFSLGGNILLGLLGAWGEGAPAEVDSALAVCPPIDLPHCSRNISVGLGRGYDRRFATMIYKGLQHRKRRRDDVLLSNLSRRPRNIRQFDSDYTAPLWGFRSVEEYMERTSSAPLIPHIRTPTLILAAADDPVVPVDIFGKLDPSPCVQLHVAEGGGHMGFIAAAGTDPDRRWLDWRILEWIAALPGGKQHPQPEDSPRRHGGTRRTAQSQIETVSDRLDTKV